MRSSVVSRIKQQAQEVVLWCGFEEKKHPCLGLGSLDLRLALCTVLTTCDQEYNLSKPKIAIPV